MPPAPDELSFKPATVLLVLGGVGLYIGSRAAADALSRRADRRLPAGRLPGRLAVGHWGPVALVALFAAFAGRADIALGVVFGTTVATLALGVGVVTYLDPPDALPPTRRAWPFLLAGAVFVLVAGFAGRLTPVHAVMLMVLGAAVLGVWRAAAAEDLAVGRVLSREAPSDDEVLPPPGDRGLRIAQAVLAVGVAAAAARAAVEGTVTADAASRIFRAALLSAGVLSPMLTLPMLATGTDLAQRNRSAEASGAFAGVALLNVFVLLPAVILVWYAKSFAAAGGFKAASAAAAAVPRVEIVPPDFQPVPLGPIRLWWSQLAAVYAQGSPVPLPRTVWRVDVVVLAVLGLLLVPVALGRWVIGRLEATGLVLAYAAYLAATAALSARR